ncbi:hypothetical protein [Sulfurirhabdus autotrophica]|uniref:VCBS repeat protein n=2 Tax=Sulfurirhabdus autotrophica TaxID=1706046 RepID=A0A4V2W1X5_9PROT|nr:hypothetical protein [Sulfurirhabdus autotrophica]TCV85829.1 hypothetical protein EDC63_10837 [Sulfurirhabdus autotrophica]
MSNKMISRYRNNYSTKKQCSILVTALVVTIGFTSSVLADDGRRNSENNNQLQFSFQVKTSIERISPEIPTGFGMPMKYTGTAEIIKITKDPMKKLRMHAKGKDTGYIEFPSQIVLPDGSITRDPIAMQVVGTPNLFGGRVSPMNSTIISFGDIDGDGVEDTVITHGNGFSRMVTLPNELPAVIHYFGLCTVDGGTGLFANAKGDIFLEGDMVDPDGPMGPQLPYSVGVDKAFITLP